MHSPFVNPNQNPCTQTLNLRPACPSACHVTADNIGSSPRLAIRGLLRHGRCGGAYLLITMTVSILLFLWDQSLSLYAGQTPCVYLILPLTFSLFFSQFFSGINTTSFFLSSSLAGINSTLSRQDSFPPKDFHAALTELHQHQTLHPKP